VRRNKVKAEMNVYKLVIKLILYKIRE